MELSGAYKRSQSTSIMLNAPWPPHPPVNTETQPEDTPAPEHSWTVSGNR